MKSLLLSIPVAFYIVTIGDYPDHVTQWKQFGQHVAVVGLYWMVATEVFLK